MSVATDIVPVETDLIVIDVLGNRRKYALTDVMAHIIGPERAAKTPIMQQEMFCAYCTAVQGNPLTREIYPLLYWSKKDNQYNLSPHPSIQFLYRAAAEARPRYLGTVKYLCDIDENPVPKTRGMEGVVGAVAEVHLEGREFPVREVVTLEEAWKEKSDFWKNPKQQPQMLLVRAEHRALRAAFPPAMQMEYSPEALALSDRAVDQEGARIIDAEVIETEGEQASEAAQTDAEELIGDELAGQIHTDLGEALGDIQGASAKDAGDTFKAWKHDTFGVERTADIPAQHVERVTGWVDEYLTGARQAAESAEPEAEPEPEAAPEPAADDFTDDVEAQPEWDGDNLPTKLTFAPWFTSLELTDDQKAAVFAAAEVRKTSVAMCTKAELLALYIAVLELLNSPEPEPTEPQGDGNGTLGL